MKLLPWLVILAAPVAAQWVPMAYNTNTPGIKPDGLQMPAAAISNATAEGSLTFAGTPDKFPGLHRIASLGQPQTVSFTAAQSVVAPWYYGYGWRSATNANGSVLIWSCPWFGNTSVTGAQLVVDFLVTTNGTTQALPYWRAISIPNTNAFGTDYAVSIPAYSARIYDHAGWYSCVVTTTIPVTAQMAYISFTSSSADHTSNYWVRLPWVRLLP